MIKKNKIILFLLFLFLFFLITPLIILYSQGYRFDLEKKKITQTGVFYFKIWPRSAEIYLNNQLKKKTGFFSDKVALENLLPKKYKIEVKKEGFYSWEKKLEIKEKLVTEAKNIILFPKDIKFEPLANSFSSNQRVENLFYSPDEKTLILKKILPEKISWMLEFFNLEKNTKNFLLEEKDFHQNKKIDLINIEFLKDQELILKTKNKEEKVFSLKLGKNPPLLEEIKTPPPTETKKEFSFNKDKFLIENNILYQFNFTNQSFEKIFEPIKKIKVSPDEKKILYFSDYEIWIIYLDDEPDFYHKKGDRVFISRFSEKIKDIFWLNSYYLLFNLEKGQIKISEIDDRDVINIYDLKKIPDSQIFWNKYEKKIYLLTEEKILVSEKILP